MAVQAITNATPINKEGNLDIAVIGIGVNGKPVQVQRSLGPDTTNWKTFKVYAVDTSEVVVNVGNNSFRLFADVAGVAVTCNQV